MDSLTDILGLKVAWATGVFAGFVTFFAVAAMVAVLWYGAHQVFDGVLTAGALTSYVLYTLTVGVALGGLTGLFSSIMQALGACERVFQLIDRQPAINITGGVELPEFRGNIRLDNVFFSYPSRPEIPILRGLSLEIQPGTITALVGPSGGGKSTIAALIERFYDLQAPNDSGAITIDGAPLHSIDPVWYHSHVALISQEPVLFATTIRENVLYGVRNPSEVSDSALEEACRMANALEFIQTFPDRYDTIVGERGIKLSGGQKQRIAIARAFLMNPVVLLADEPTSALDAESEHLVQIALERLMKNRSVLIIAHRLSTVKRADLVCVITDGRIMESGKHTELLALEGIYAKLVEKQLLKYDSKDNE